MDIFTIAIGLFSIAAAGITGYWAARAGVMSGIAKLEERVDGHTKDIAHHDERLKRLEAPFFNGEIRITPE